MLHFTVKCKHDQCLEVLLNAGEDVNVTDDSLFTPLMRAAENDYVKGVESLLQAGADVNGNNEDSKTALGLALLKGHDECVELLINAGADVNTALHAAVKSKNVRDASENWSRCEQI